MLVTVQIWRQLPCKTNYLFFPNTNKSVVLFQTKYKVIMWEELWITLCMVSGLIWAVSQLIKKKKRTKPYYNFYISLSKSCCIVVNAGSYYWKKKTNSTVFTAKLRGLISFDTVRITIIIDKLYSKGLLWRGLLWGRCIRVTSYAIRFTRNRIRVLISQRIRRISSF